MDPRLKVHEHPECAAARRAGLGACCEACGCADGRVLKRHRLGTLCANCATIVGRRAVTLDELRAEVEPRAA